MRNSLTPNFLSKTKTGFRSHRSITEQGANLIKEVSNALEYLASSVEVTKSVLHEPMLGIGLLTMEILRPELVLQLAGRPATTKNVNIIEDMIQEFYDNRISYTEWARETDLMRLLVAWRHDDFTPQETTFTAALIKSLK